MTPLPEAVRRACDAEARLLVAKWEHGDDAHRAWLRSVAVPDIASALATARAEGAAEEREACARIAHEGCLVPPDGGSPSSEELAVCDHIERYIRARVALPTPPAPDPRDAEIATLRAEVDALRLAIQGGEDAPGHAASLPLDVILDNARKLHADATEGWANPGLRAEVERLRQALERAHTPIRDAINQVLTYTRARPMTSHEDGQLDALRKIEISVAQYAARALAPKP